MTHARRLHPTGKRRLVATLVALAMASAVVSAFPWTRDMFVGPVVHTYEYLLTPPADVLAVDGPRILGRRESRAQVNPLPASANVLAEGAAIYQAYCTSCHGDDGSGTGPLVQYFDRSGDLGDEEVQEVSDGEMYNTIREGGFQMPGFAASLSVRERWAVIHHVRTYQ